MQPHDDILSRDIETEEYANFLETVGNMLDECVNYGTHVISWINIYHKGNYSDLIILMLVRHVIEMLDGCTILIRKGCVEPTEPLLRSIFEAMLSLEYIFQEDTVRRALAYQVAYVHNKLTLYKRADNNTQEGKNYRATLKKDKIVGGLELPNYDSSKPIENLESMLKKPEFIEIEKEWQKVKKKKNGKAPHWYALFGGPSSLFELADKVNLLGMYETLYRMWSQSVHAIDAIKHLGKSNGLGVIYGLRNPKNLESCTTLCVNSSLHIYRSAIAFYVPDKLTEYGLWYRNNIRELNLVLSSKNKILHVK